MSTSLYRFLAMYRDGSIENDVAWRGYDIPASWRGSHVPLALRAIGLSYAGEHALAQFMALYEVPDVAEAEKLLGCWWLWSRLAQGTHSRVVKKRAMGDL